MSLGWLTESALALKKPTPISGVSSASLLNLKAVVYEREQRGSLPSAKRRRQLAEAAQNEGVAARIAKDEQERAAAAATPANIESKLREKARRYDAMMAGRAAPGDEGLVDFARKRDETDVVAEFASVEHVVDTIGAPTTAEALPHAVPGCLARVGGAAIAPPVCLGGSISAAVSSTLPAPAAVEPDVPVGGAARASATAGPVSCMRQAFDRRPASAEDRARQDRLHEETEACRETVGQERRHAREAVKDRLAALRAAKAQSSSAGL